MQNKFYKYCKSQVGMVLITTMLFVTLLSMLAITLLQTNLLVTKISNYNRDQIRAKYLAEVNLKKYETEILEGKPEANHVRIIDSKDICGVIFYEVNASATYGLASVKLQSTFAKVDAANCNPKPNIQTGRLSFKEI